MSYRLLRIPKKITSKDSYKLLLILFWGKDFACAYARAVFLRLPVISMIADWIIPIMSLVCFLFALPYIKACISGADFLFVLTAAFAYCLNILIYPETADYLIEYAWEFWISIFPLFIVGLRVDPEEDVRLLYYVSLINLWLYFVYIQLFGEDFTQQRALHSGAMGRAYRLLPQLLMISIFVFRERTVWNVTTLIIGFVNLLACGTRGAVICLFVFELLYGIFYVSSKKELGFLIVVTLAMILFLLFFDGILLWLRTIAVNWGMSERIFNYIESESFFVSKSRLSLSRQAMEAIGQRPVLGYGIAGDRMVMGNYSHNLILEMLVSFGILLGTVVLVYLVQLIFRAYIKSPSSWGKDLVLLLFCAGIVKLFFSSSYLLEPLFFLTLGVCIGQIRIGKRRSRIQRLRYFYDKR